jgi:hypothetical protein
MFPFRVHSHLTLGLCIYFTVAVENNFLVGGLGVENQTGYLQQSSDFTPRYLYLWGLAQEKVHSSHFCGIHPVAVYNINIDIRTAVNHNENCYS